MHARVLRYLDEVVRAGSFRRAALQLHVAPTAINRQILELEAELGAPIFDRIGKRLRLTPLGELVLAHVRQTLREHKALLGKVEEHRGMRRGEATLAALTGLASSLLPGVVHEFRRQHAGIVVRVHDLPVAEIVKAVESGAADLGLAYNVPEMPAFRMLDSSDWPLGVVVPPAHPLAGQASVVLDDCVGHPMILPAASMSMRAVLDEAFANAAIELAPVVESTSTAMMRKLVLLGSGIALLNVLDVIDERQRGVLVWVPLRDERLKSQTLKLFARSRASLPTAAELLAEGIAAQLAALGKTLH